MACNRVGNLSTMLKRLSNSRSSKLASYHHFSSSSTSHVWSSQIFAHSVEPPPFLVDTFALFKRLKAEGVPSKQAEGITTSVTQLLHDTIDNVTQSFISKGELQKMEMIQESNLSKFISEVKNSQVRRLEAEGVPSKQAEGITAAITKVLHNTIDNATQYLISKGELQKIGMIQESNLSKFISEYRKEEEHETEKLSTEMYKMRRELCNKMDKMSSELSYSISQDFHALGAEMETMKYEVLKCCIGSLVSISLIDLALLRMML